MTVQPTLLNSGLTYRLKNQNGQTMQSKPKQFTQLLESPVGQNSWKPQGSDSIIQAIIDSARLGPVDYDTDTGAKWRSGEVIPPNRGTSIPMGGGWIESDESANMRNEEAGIAGGMSQGVWYPKQTLEGSFRPFTLGEDESGWQITLMPLILGPDYRDHPEYADIELSLFNGVQKKLQVFC